MAQIYRESINKVAIKKNELTERVNIETIIKNQSKPRVISHLIHEVESLHLKRKNF